MLAIVPLERTRDQTNASVAAAQAKYDAGLAKLPADAPLRQWTPFLQTRNTGKQDEALGRIRKLARRQSDAELMLESGYFPLGLLSQIDPQPTPAICDKARALLRRQRRIEALCRGGAAGRRRDQRHELARRP